MTPDLAKSFMDGVPMPLVLIDRDDRIIAANAPAHALFGQSIAGRHYATVIRHPAVLDCITSAFESGQPRHCTYPARDQISEMTFQLRATPVETQDLSAVLLSFEDLSQLNEAGEMRRDFVANVSHELRTPLTALIGFIETLQGPARGDPQAQTRFLKFMDIEAQRMSRLIKDLLSLSSLEAQERMRPTDPVDLSAVLKAAIATLQPTIRALEAEVKITGDQSGLVVPGDTDQLQQVFRNLIENALKYGKDRVTLNVSVQSRDPKLRQRVVTIDVLDNGSGIDPLQLPRLTERFYRIDGHRSREVGGTGLGLAIVKHIINRHRGRLKISSTPGKGSTFSVVLPQKHR